MAKKQISVIERRLQGPSVLMTGSAEIPLVDKTWTLRWENSEISPDHIWHCINRLGWEYVVPEDVSCNLEEVGAAARDGRVVRGERGKEILLKMRTSDYKKVQAQKTQENIRTTFDKKKLKASVLSEVGNAHGGEAADFINKNTMNVTDSRERVSLDD